MRQNLSELIKPKHRIRCYGCHRSIDRCFCHSIPTIHNRTNVLIVQHKRERFHPFNTARILRRSLQNSRLLVGDIDRLTDDLNDISLSPHVGLLYPGAESQLLDELPVEERPRQLVILDGTWHHTKTLVREIPLLQSLRKYRLAPAQPSRYRIRREPNVLFLSTLEATVAALRCIEPETVGFDGLLQAFDGMVEGQLIYPKSADAWRKNRRRSGTKLPVPTALRDHFERIVAVYGETLPGPGHCYAGTSARVSPSDSRTPVFWVAERLASGERFERAIESSIELPSSFFAHLELPETVFANASTMPAFLQDWNAFLRPDDILTFYCSHIPKLLREIGSGCQPSLHLKGIQYDQSRKNGALEQLLDSLGIISCVPNCSGRAGKRLAHTISLVKHLVSDGREIECAAR